MQNFTKILFLTTALSLMGAAPISHAEDGATADVKAAQDSVVERYRLTRVEITENAGILNFKIDAISEEDADGYATGTNMRTKLHLDIVDAASLPFGPSVSDARLQLKSCKFLNRSDNARADAEIILNTSDESNVRTLFTVDPSDMADTGPFDVSTIIFTGKNVDVIINGDRTGNTSPGSIINETSPLKIKGTLLEFGSHSFDIARSSWRRLAPADGLNREAPEKVERLTIR